jgi:hypothetical protein
MRQRYCRVNTHDINLTKLWGYYVTADDILY